MEKALILFFAFTFFLSGKGYAEQTSRPLPVDDPRSTSLLYVFPLSPKEIYPSVLKIFKENLPVTYEKKEDKKELELYKKYGEVRSDYVYFLQNGRKCRKQCGAYVHLIPYYPNYSLVTMGCDYEGWKSNFGVHNLFDWRWSWIGEDSNSLFLDEDMLELIRKDLGLRDDEVIRLRKDYSLKELPPVIKEYEQKKAKKTAIERRSNPGK